MHAVVKEGEWDGWTEHKVGLWPQPKYRAKVVGIHDPLNSVQKCAFVYDVLKNIYSSKIWMLDIKNLLSCTCLSLLESSDFQKDSHVCAFLIG